MRTLKKWELVAQLDQLGDDVEVYLETSGEGEYEIREVSPRTASGTAAIVAGDERE